MKLNRPDLAASAVRKKATQQYQQQKHKQQQAKEIGMAAKKEPPLPTTSSDGLNSNVVLNEEKDAKNPQQFGKVSIENPVATTDDEALEDQPKKLKK